MYRQDQQEQTLLGANMLNDQQTYTADHRVAKLIVCISYIVLGAVSIETNNPYIALVLGTVVWFFGVNTVGYLIESLRGHPHQHQVL